MKLFIPLIFLSYIGITNAALTPQTEIDLILELSATILPHDLADANQYLKDTNELQEIVNRHKEDGRYIIVNISEEYIRVYDNHQLVIHEKVIVGKKSRPTPLFTSTIGSVVFAPQWSIPKRIAAEMFPAIKKAGGKPGFVFYVGGKVTPVSEISAGDKYRIIQLSGPTTALGKFKFNTLLGKYSVFIHGTPNRNLFNRKSRRFSSGCIRMENPIKLASFLLKKDAGIIEETLKTANNSYNRVSKQIQVYTVNWNHWFDENAELVHFDR